MSLESYGQSSEIPSSVQTEVTVLGAMMLDALAIQDATAKLQPYDFTLDSHQVIYKAMKGMVSGGFAVDLITVMDALTRAGRLAAIGGAAYLAYLTEGIPRRPNIESYVRIIKEKSVLRQGLTICDTGVRRFSEPGADAVTIASETQAALAKAVAGVAEEPSLEEQSEREFEVMERQRNGEVAVFVPSGIESLDKEHGGFAIGEMTVIAAWPNVGKSTWLRQAILKNCEDGRFVHLFTPEMREGSVLRCLWAAVAQIPYEVVRFPRRMSEKHLHLIECAKKAVAGMPLKIDATAQLTASEMISRARRVKLEFDTQLCGLDYFQRLALKDGTANQASELSAISKSLSGLAKEGRGMALVVVSSLTEESGGKKGGTPTMYHLRGTGNLKYDADTIYLLDRKTNAETLKLVPKTSLIAGKGRFVETGAMDVFFDGSMQRFETEEEFQRRFQQ